MLKREVVISILVGALTVVLPCAAQTLTNGELSVTVNDEEGSYSLAPRYGQPVLAARVGAQVDHEWLRSSDYAHCRSASSSFSDELGPGHQVSVICGGREGSPDLVYVVQLYDQEPYGALQVKVHNGTGRPVVVQAIRSVDAVGQPLVNLGGRASANRVLSDSFSEDWPDLKIYDLGKAPGGMHRGVGSQLIYNRKSQESLFLGALTSDRFLTIMHLQADDRGGEEKIASYTVESTGTTEIQKDFDLKQSPVDDQVELTLTVAPGQELASERILFEVGKDYHRQLLAYGDAIRRLHHARVNGETPMGWWSWTAYYGAINEGETLANADWQSQHLKSLGYKYFQIDEGYQYARGEFTMTNAVQFPDGMRFVGHRIVADGLTLGLWTAPFEVTTRAWVYEHHKDWLVHNAKGQPIAIGDVWHQGTDRLYALDATNPGAQDYLRETYKTIVREWGVRFIKLDFMDTTAIEGYYYRPNTTALEAQRIGLQIIRDTVGNDVVLDKDGSPMLNPVGLVDTGRVSADTGHNFERTRTAEPGIAARFYMHHNFFINDPDAFNVTDSYLMEERESQPPVSLPGGQASIALSAVSGGMYEIGDDMLLLGSEKDRLALVENRDLLNMVKVGRAATPLDLMTYEPEDEQPSIFFLREDRRQSMLVVFNWTKTARTHALELADLGLRVGDPFVATDVFNPDERVPIAGTAVRITNEDPQSVKVIKIVDTKIAPAAPTITAQVPSRANAGETIEFSAKVDAAGVPSISYLWDFGDGTTANGSKSSHTYTRAADFDVHLTVEGLDGVSAQQTFSVKVTGTLHVMPKLRDNRRFVEPTSH
jgi:hypothetical protein